MAQLTGTMIQNIAQGSHEKFVLYDVVRCKMNVKHICDSKLCKTSWQIDKINANNFKHQM